VAAGLSNPAIAEKLVLSRRTVEAHLRSIFNKLEVTSRAEAALFAIKHNLSLTYITLPLPQART
jgi:DNA-binding NarL/FixJ family response regulator